MGAMHDWAARLCELPDDKLLDQLNYRAYLRSIPGGDGWDQFGLEVCLMELRRRGIEIIDISEPPCMYARYRFRQSAKSAAPDVPDDDAKSEVG